MKQYSELANYYDLLMFDVDYKKWTQYIMDIFSKYGKNPSNILDIACGTGRITIELASLGYKMTGVDISEEMLSVAENNMRNSKHRATFIKQDMVNISIKEKFDCVLCLCDGVNYVEEYELIKYFQNVYNVLNDNGIFIFDISTLYKLQHILGNNTYYYEVDDICYVWENEFNDDNTVSMHLVFFVKHEENYKKFEEYHTQKAYDINEIYKALEKIGFCNINCFDGLSFKKVNNISERAFFIATK